MYHIALLWFCVCSALHVVGALVLRPHILPLLKHLQQPKRDLRELPNTLVAATHAATMFVGAARYMLPKLDFAREGFLLFPIPSVRPNTPTEEFWLEAMLGYLVYDSAAGVFTGGNTPDIVLHHVMGIASWGSLLHFRVGGIYAMWIHLAEARPASTPFLHTATTLYKLQLGDSLAFKLASLMLLVLFTLLRIGVSPLCAASLWVHRAKWGAENMWLLYTNLVVTVLFLGVNFVWWTKLLKRAFGLGGGAGGKKKKEPAGGGGGGGARGAGGGKKEAAAPAAAAGGDKRE